MKARVDSLYLRLALVLAVALGAGFGTMGWFFHRHVRHMEQDRARGERHGMTAAILGMESRLRQGAAPDSAPARGSDLLFRGALPDHTEAGPPPDLPPGLARHLADELGRPVEVRHPAGAQSGLWVRLETPESFGPAWLFLAPPGPGPGVEPWTWGLLVSFAVVFVGGMTLLWRVQVPLRKMEKVLRQMGPAAETPLLEVAGPREVRNLAQQFNEMTARLHQHERDRQEMLAGVAHDLRAPVTRLRLQLELENGPRKGAMVRNLDSIEAIVDQFLLFARGGDGEALAELDVGAFLAEVAASYEDHGVRCELPARDVILALRPNGLHRALCNLIDNALEYGAAPITVVLRECPAEIVIAVIDHGAGIDVADRSLALRPFTRLDEARSSQGHCGLGLAIVNRIAHSQDGRLELHDVPGGGFEARLVFPRPATH